MFLFCSLCWSESTFSGFRSGGWLARRFLRAACRAARSETDMGQPPFAILFARPMFARFRAGLRRPDLVYLGADHASGLPQPHRCTRIFVFQRGLKFLASLPNFGSDRPRGAPSISSAVEERNAPTPSWMMSSEMIAAASESAHHQPMPEADHATEPGRAGQPIRLVHQRVGVEQFVVQSSCERQFLAADEQGGTSE